MSRSGLLLGIVLGTMTALLLHRRMLPPSSPPQRVPPPPPPPVHNPPPPSPPPPPPPPPPATVAICVGGYLELSIPRRAASLREHVLSVLPSDVFVAGTVRGNGTARRVGEALEGIDALAPFAAASVIRMPRPAELRAELKRSGHWVDFKTQASKGGSGRFNWADPRYEDPTLWVPIMMSPALGNPNGNTLQEFHYQSRCIEMITAYERAGGGVLGAQVASSRGGGLGAGYRRASRLLQRASGRPPGLRYERVMFTRLEMEWHPPLSLLDARYLWVPTGEDNTGVNDRHWLASRDDAEGVFRRWDALVSGAFHEIFFASSQVRPAFMSSETYNKLHLQYRRVGVARFPNVAALQCCETSYADGSSAARRGMHCFAKDCHRTPCPSRQLPTPTCRGPRGGARVGSEGAPSAAHGGVLSHKYEAEGLSAVVHATALSFPGARLVFAPDATPARLHIEMPPVAGGGADRGLLYTCKVCEGGPAKPDAVSRNVTSCLFHGHSYTHPVLEAARKVHNCRYFTERHLASVCAALGDRQVRTGRFGWFCNDVERWQ